MKSKWFAIRSYFEWRATGRPKNVDRWYRKAGFLIEEQLLLIRASSKAMALKKAKSQARKYCPYSFKNIYGETVRTRLIQTIDCEVVESLKSGSEVLAVTEFVTARPSRKLIASKTIGGKLLQNEKKLRRKFEHADLRIPKRLKLKYGIK